MQAVRFGGFLLAVGIAVSPLGGCAILTCDPCSSVSSPSLSYAGTQAPGNCAASGFTEVAPITVTAVGYGAADERHTNKSQKALMALRASEVDAYRALAERVQGVNLSSNTSVSDFITNHDHLRVWVDAYIRNAVVISQGQTAEGHYQTTLSLTLDQEFFSSLGPAKKRRFSPCWFAHNDLAGESTSSSVAPRSVNPTLSTTDVHFELGAHALRR